MKTNASLGPIKPNSLNSFVVSTRKRSAAETYIPCTVSKGSIINYMISATYFRRISEKNVDLNQDSE
jgi:hypothetical protein